MNTSDNSDDIKIEDFESMLEESLTPPSKGALVKGEIASMDGDNFIVNLHHKTEGIIHKDELPGTPKIGDSVELVVMSFSGAGGYIQLATKQAAERAELSGGGKDGQGGIVKVKVDSRTDKGFRGKVGDIDAFIPENHIDLKSKVKDPSQYIGKTMQAKVLKVSQGKYKSYLVSPKEYLLDQQNKERNNFFKKIEPGQVIKGTVKTLKDYGAFVNLGSVVDGFLHKSNIAWGRPKSPSKYVQEGQEIEVKILEVNAQESKIEVGLKQLTSDPWETVRERYPKDATVKASVIGRRRAGFIGEIEPGIDAYIPLEELSWLKNARHNIDSRDMVEGRVLDYDDIHKRIVISVKMALENPWAAIREEASEGTVVDCTVKSVTDFGVFVDFGHAIDGLIRIGDISWVEEPKDISSMFKQGDKLEAKVLKIDEEKERVNLGIKQLATNPWKDVSKGSRGTPVTVAQVTKTGLEVLLDNGIKGFIPSNELDPDRPELDKYQTGDALDAAIIKSDQKEKTILLSVRKLITESERKETKEYMKKLERSDDNQNFGNIFKDKLTKE